MPRVSVILSVHNGMPYLLQAVESVLQQTFRDCELIIVDDGSTDDTPDYLAEVLDNRLRVLRNTSQSSVARSLNRAISQSMGEYIAPSQNSGREWLGSAAFDFFLEAI